MRFWGHFLVPHAGRELAFFSRKHFWHSLKKHVVGFKVVCKNQSSFFSETSLLNPINIQDLNRHFLANAPGGIPTYLCRSQPYLLKNLCRPLFVQKSL